jgi:hypothetical protein
MPKNHNYNDLLEEKKSILEKELGSKAFIDLYKAIEVRNS